MGKKKGKATPPSEGDDAILAAAMAQAAEERAAQQARKDQARKEQLMASQLGIQQRMEPQLGVKALVELLDAVPTFAIMNEVGTQKRFVPMRFSEDSTATDAPEVCAFFLDPAEAKRSLQQAQSAAPDMTLVLGAMPLGHGASAALDP
jgi:hypothetical protein